MKSKQRLLVIAITSFLMSGLLSVVSGQKSFNLTWTDPVIELTASLKSVKKLYFKKAFYSDIKTLHPSFYISEYFSGNVKSVEFKTSNIVTQELNEDELKLIGKKIIPSSLVVNPVVKEVGNRSLVQVFGNALLNVGGKAHKVISFDYSIGTEFMPKRKTNEIRRRGGGSPGTCDLQSGTWFKIPVTTTGIHKLSKDYFISLGVDISNFNPKNIRIYGNGTGMLPEENQIDVPETLEEVQILVQGETDGVFNDADYVLFYAVGPHVWDYDAALQFYAHRQNLYSDTAYYFLNFDLGLGKRIDAQGQSSGSSNYTVTTNDLRKFHEKDETNLLKTGKSWLGEYFDLTTSYSNVFSMPNIVTSVPVKINAKFAVRSFTSVGNDLTITVNGSAFQSKNSISAVSTFYTNLYAQEVSMFGTMSVSSSSLTINSIYGKPQASSVAWLDFITVNATGSLSFSSGQLDFRNSGSVNTGNISKFFLTSGSDLTIWDVSDPLNVHSQAHNYSSGTLSFNVTTSELKEFVAYNGSSFIAPGLGTKVVNQNITRHINKEYILICAPEFKTLSQELVDFHSSQNNLSGAVVTTEQVYNEFSSGAQDITAIRNYMKYLYENSGTKPKYLMLVGDGSYDYKYRLSNNTNFIPSFQSKQSYHPLSSFTSDDYFGLLNDSVSILNNLATLDIGIGRAPVKDQAELQSFIEKVKIT
jgi:hypothetical protein